MLTITTTAPALTRLLGLLQRLLSLIAPLLPLGQLTALHGGRLAVKHVHGLNAIVHHTDRAVEKAHQVTVRNR